MAENDDGKQAITGGATPRKFQEGARPVVNTARPQQGPQGASGGSKSSSGKRGK